MLYQFYLFIWFFFLVVLAYHFNFIVVLIGVWTVGSRQCKRQIDNVQIEHSQFCQSHDSTKTASQKNIFNIPSSNLWAIQLECLVASKCLCSMFNVRIRIKRGKNRRKKIGVWNVCVAFHHDGDPIHCKRFQLSVTYYGWWLNRFYFILFGLFVWFVLFSQYGCVRIAHQIWFIFPYGHFSNSKFFPYAYFLMISESAYVHMRVYDFIQNNFILSSVIHLRFIFIWRMECEFLFGFFFSVRRFWGSVHSYNGSSIQGMSRLGSRNEVNQRWSWDINNRCIALFCVWIKWNDCSCQTDKGFLITNSNDKVLIYWSTWKWSWMKIFKSPAAQLVDDHVDGHYMLVNNRIKCENTETNVHFVFVLYAVNES